MKNPLIIDRPDLQAWQQKAIFGALGSGIEANEFGFGSSATSASQRLVFNQNNGQLLYDADGSGEGAAVQFASLSNKPEISANDFLVVA